MRKFLGFSLFLALVAIDVQAEFVCRAQVGYKWKQGSGDTVKENEVIWSALESVGADEKAAKGRLNEIATRERSKAADVCSREHENLAGCIAAKFNGMSQTIQTLSFSGRKALEAAISKDCEVLQGICSYPGLSEPVCEEKIAPVEAADAGKKDDKKADKGKKK